MRKLLTLLAPLQQTVLRHFWREGRELDLERVDVRNLVCPLEEVKRVLRDTDIPVPGISSQRNDKGV